MDLTGPLPKSGQELEHILVIVDYTTRYPEALPLRKTTSKAIAKELFLFLMADLCHLLQVKQLRTSIYHL